MEHKKCIRCSDNDVLHYRVNKRGQYFVWNEDDIGCYTQYEFDTFFEEIK